MRRRGEFLPPRYLPVAVDPERDERPPRMGAGDSLVGKGGERAGDVKRRWRWKAGWERRRGTGEGEEER
eukprot:750519-Hanusia_phi.AAC.4